MSTYTFATAGFTVSFANANSLGGAPFLVAANNGLGSNLVGNDGGGLLYISPIATNSGSGNITVGATGTPMFGATLATSQGGEPYAQYVFTLPTPDATVPLMQIGGLVIDANTATVANMTSLLVTSQAVILNTAGGTPFYTANATAITTSVPSYLDGVLSDLEVYGNNSPTKLNVVDAGGAGILVVDTNGPNLVVGTAATTLAVSTDVASIINGSLVINKNTGSTQHLLAQTQTLSGSTVTTKQFLLLDTINAVFNVTGVSCSWALQGGLQLSGGASAAKFAVINASNITTFGVDTENGYVTVGGTDSGVSAYKFSITDSANTTCFGVVTDATQVNQERIDSISIFPTTPNLAMGSGGSPWQFYGTINPPSDVRLKEKITPMSNAMCAEFVDRAQVRSFAYKNDPERLHAGLITQEIMAIDPAIAQYLVNMGPEEGAVYQTLSLYSLVGVLMGALQETRAELAALKKAN